MGYIGAPYNFVKLYKNVYERYNSVSDLPRHDEISDDSLGKLPCHDEIRTDLLSGEITCKIKAETPIFISDGAGEFYKTLKGKYAIPGSSLRGLASSNMSVLGFCSVGEDIADRRFMYRQIGGGNNELKERYKEVIWHKDNRNNVRNIIAGFIKNENGKYYICKASGGGNGGTNFYTLSEKYIHTQNFQYIHGEMMYNDCNFERTEQSNKNGKKVIHYKNKNENKRYIPYSHKVFYTLDDDVVSGVSEYTEKEAEKKAEENLVGYIVSSGFVKEKKKLYLIPYDKKEKKEFVKVADKKIIEFEDDFRNRKTTFSKKVGNNNLDFKDYYDLPKEGEIKPVFVLWNINKNNEFTGDFGFTPNIRISYDKSVHDLIPEAHKINNQMIIDYKKAMFGFISEKYAYKSRLSFEDAEIISDERKSAEVGIPAAGPKPSSYYDYLDGVDYNGNLLDKERKESGNIRGIKQYWLRDFIYGKDISQISPDMIIKFKPLAENTAFKGRIKFKNLNEDELGLLLWCLRLNDNCYHNIGMGKAYGYGRIKIDDIVVSLYDYTKLYNSDDIYFNGIYSQSDKSVDEYICKYKDKISKEFLKSKSVDDSVDDIESIKNFMLMKKTVFNKNEAENIRYMDIDKKEYQSRNEYLPYAEEVVKGINDVCTADNEGKKSNGDDNKNRYAKDGNKKGKNSGNKNNKFNNGFKNNQLANALDGIKFDD